MGMSGGSGGGPMGDINVTPLVDVMLVLLIIFMVTAPMMNAGVDIDLPKVDAPPISQDSEEQLVLAIDKDLNYYIGDNKFTADEMPVKLKAIVERNPDQPVFLRADGDVPYREVAYLMAAAKTAGVPRVGLVFEPGAGE
jgi:biopolymer transport protein TolR